MFSEFFVKENSLAVAVSETAKFFKIVGCEEYKLLASKIVMGGRNYFSYQGKEVN